MKNSIVTINGKRGEYTGFSRINGEIVHYFSMYDGSVVRRDSLRGLGIEPYEAPKELGGQFAYPESILP